MTRILEKRRTLHRKLASQENTARQLKNQLDLIQPMANIGMISAMIAHEINNILTPLGTYAELALQNPEDTALAEKVLKKTAHNSSRAAKILEALLNISRGKSNGRKRYSLKLLIDEVFTCIARDFSKDKITITMDICEDLKVWVENIPFQHVLMNLILNAREAMLPNGGQLKLTAIEDTNMVLIQISDTGCGIKDEDMDKLFDPFFTTKPKTSESGCGLGLTYCKKIIEAHHGKLCVTSSSGKGATFMIYLPVE